MTRSKRSPTRILSIEALQAIRGGAINVTSGDASEKMQLSIASMLGSEAQCGAGMTIQRNTLEVMRTQGDPGSM